MTGLRLHSHQTSEAESEHRSAFRCSALPHHLTTVATWVTVKHSGVGGAYPPAPTGTCHYHSISTSTSTLGCGLAQQRKDWRERTWGDRKIGGGKRKVDQLIDLIFLVEKNLEEEKQTHESAKTHPPHRHLISHPSS